ncbi:MAG: cupin domain-containing protein [Hyphomonadaceae bacterium]|nr:cupin domain-containing protein [Hyphomonadaceae bacterium]
MMKVTSGQVMDEATRAALASGRAEPALGLLIDSLMQMRGISELAGEAVAGAALETETPAELSPDALARVFAAIDKGGTQRRASEYGELIKLPPVLMDAILAAETKTGWSGAGPGVRKLKLGLDGEARAEIIRIDAGVAIPWHTHKGQELTLCLVGGFSDGRGSYGPGDVSLADPSVRHQPKADDDGACFVLAVTDAGLKFEGLLGAIQKLTGG